MPSRALVAILHRSVLELPRTDLIKRTDLEEETIDDVLRILREEFE